MGDIPISNPDKTNHEDNVVRVWKSQFPKEVRRIRLTHVIEKIVNDSDVGPSFIINFLVLYRIGNDWVPVYGDGKSNLFKIISNWMLILLDWTGADLFYHVRTQLE